MIAKERCGKCRNCIIASNRTCDPRAIFITANISAKPWGDESEYPCADWIEPTDPEGWEGGIAKNH